MRKLIPVIAAAAAAAILLFGRLGGTGVNPADIRKIDQIPLQVTVVQKEGLAPHRYIDALVTKVSDGDTVEVTYKGKVHKVRLLYIDTPESVKQGVPVQPYSSEASKFTQNMLYNKQVRLVFDKGLRDRYGRLLAHVLLKDGSYFNALLVRNGFARVEAVSPNTALKDYFLKLQESAINEKLGLWSLPENKRPFVKNNKGEYIARYLQKAN